MTTSTETSTRPTLFPYERWTAQLDELAPRYRANQPFPHLCLPDFLAEDVARGVRQAFPEPHDTTWIQYKHFNENKLGKSKREEFPAAIGALIDEFLTPEFVAWVSVLTGIEGLMADPSLEGGGMHQTECGGFLNMHADFTMHHYHRNWRRRCNLILYLNEGWQENWGGAIEFWDRDMAQCVAKVPPLFNQAVIFNTTETSYHGYPDPIQCPEGTTRKSLALYYYTIDDSPRPAAKSTNYRARPGDGAKRLGIWLDTKALAMYSWLKTKLGLSDDFASRVLGILSRKK
jgi:hypothetical protein